LPWCAGTLPSSWGALTNLKALGLSGNKLTGTLPDSWSNMAALQELYLGMNRLVGTVPASWGRLTNLRGVDLTYNEGLTGCLPRTWRDQINNNGRITLGNGLRYGNTGITGFC
jgi:Leucine-rich repeat (LRR) protein